MVDLIKRTVLVALLAVVVVPMFGCGVGTTRAENNRTIRRVADYDARMMTDDLGLLAQVRRPWHGSRFPIK